MLYLRNIMGFMVHNPVKRLPQVAFVVPEKLLY
jgi:hypothetical protein